MLNVQQHCTSFRWRERRLAIPPGRSERTETPASPARLAFDEVRSSLSARLTAVSASNFDAEVARALCSVVDVIPVDRGLLLELRRDGTLARRWTAGWTAGNRTWEEARLPWTMAALRRGEAVTLIHDDDRPIDAAEDRRACDADGVRALVALPLIAGGRHVGALFLGSGHAGRDAPDFLPEVLPVLGDLFANALSRHQGEVEIQRLRQELAHIGRVSALGELAASLAHELNQPLTAILNNAQVALRLLAAGTADLGEMREILTDIVSDDKRAAAIIGRVRLLLKKGDPDYVVLDLNGVVAEIARLVTVDVGTHNVTMRVDLSPDLPRVRGDRVQLQQVVLNLVLNALEAMREPDREGALVISTFRVPGDGVGVAVCDAGCGIPARDTDQIFEPLFTTKSDGLGMGLAIARTIVNAHGGRLEARNNVGHGATLRFTLPTAEPGA